MKKLSQRNMSEYKELLAIAIKAAIKAGRRIYSHWENLQVSDISQKSSWKDLVTIADKEAEGIILEIVTAKFPHHQIISEEGGGQKTDSKTDSNSDYQWAIDPLDGTTNFCHSYPFFCTSIGVLHQGEAVVGVVYDPVHDELFTAIRGQGAYLNGRPISVSKTSSLEAALLVTGFFYDVDDLQKASLDLFKKFNLICHGVRRDGAAALDLCYVAAGRLDGFWEYGLKVWDVTAGSLLVCEAGGIVSDTQGKDFDFFGRRLLASNGLLHQELVKCIQEGMKEGIDF